ncbi:DNA/RNA non-specific endonuclease [Hirsutella rhossiliensis]|uniref:Endonuclease n=1 Tax=Hirsutella rhossiliensis TaxID=111463 RepID=A0A9P8N0I9_9HYPO|nr:DNA/RNA non-specific endonuclease domain-containing protein [Hirsutella rhossiliensis]KAH0965918.1 DNA/RNA non-specific endonuclease domain-containing protein [Hirsutella rhossiliensis]
MSKSTLAMFAALGAGGGAALTAAVYSFGSSSVKKPESQVASTTTLTTTTSTKPSAVAVAAPPFTPTAAVAGSPVNPAGLFEYGFPGPVSDIASRSALVSSYDRRMRNPHWVVEHITPASLAMRDADRRHSAFVEDHAIPAPFRALLRDYYRSGYDRGHQVPAADAKWSQRAMDDTFYLSNMCPQVGEGFNRDYWAHFEDFCRRLTVQYPSVRIVTGPLYLPRKDPVDDKWYVKYEMIGSPPSVAVPTHFYKVIFAEDGNVGGNVAIGAFVLPNAPISNDKPLTDFEVPVEAVERASGLEFATKLPVQRRRRLCADMACALVIKDYADKQKAFGKTDARAISPPKS